jgi:membrane associated rhomboid family serine protease
MTSQIPLAYTVKYGLTFLVLLWCTYFVECVFPVLKQWGLEPRSLTGLIGIFSMHFLHGSFQHLVSNTLPLLILMFLLMGSRRDALRIMLAIAIAASTLLWMVGRPAIHIGASLLIYGLISFLIVAGLVEKRWLDLSVSILVLILYGGSLLWGILPWMNQQVSWDGHLCGALAGGLLAYANRRVQSTKLPES